LLIISIDYITTEKKKTQAFFCVFSPFFFKSKFPK